MALREAWVLRFPYAVWFGAFYDPLTDTKPQGWHVKWLYLRMYAHKHQERIGGTANTKVVGG